MTTREETYATEAAAKTARREHIYAGRPVSLIGYDGDRDVYAFNVDPTGRAAFLDSAKASASRAGLTVPERLAYVTAEAARYDADQIEPVHPTGCGLCGTW